MGQIPKTEYIFFACRITDTVVYKLCELLGHFHLITIADT